MMVANSSYLDALINDQRIVEAMSIDGDHLAMLHDLEERALAVKRTVTTRLPEWCWPRTVTTELERAHALLPSCASVCALLATPEYALDRPCGPFEQSAVVLWMLTGAPRSVADAPATRPDFARVRYVPPDRPEVALLEGDAGVGKSRVARVAVALFQLRQLLTSIVAPTNLAACAFADQGGTSVHALFNLGIDSEADEFYVIDLSPAGTVSRERADVLRSIALLVVDECWATKGKLVDALVDFLVRIGSRARILLAGDSRQLPPVVVSGTRDEILSASLLMSRTLQNLSAKFVMTVQYRQRDPEYAEWVRTIGDGSAPAVEGHEYNDAEADCTAVRATMIGTVFYEKPAPPAMQTRRASAPRGLGDDAAREAAVRHLWGTGAHGALSVGGANRAILVTTNAQRNSWNALVVSMLRRTSAQRSLKYVAHTRYQLVHDADGLEDADGEQREAIEAHVAQWRPPSDRDDGTMPEHETDLAPGDVCLLSTTVDRAAGLVKNRRVTVVELRWHAVVVAIVGDDQHLRHTICRQCFTVDLRGLSKGIKVWRKQIPLVHAFAVTMHKAQGMTLERALLDLTRAFFSHGHAYLGPGRVSSRYDISAYCDERSSVLGANGSRVPIIANVVYPQFALARQ